MRTQVEENKVEFNDIDYIIYKAFNTVFNAPSMSNVKFTFQEVGEFLDKLNYRIVRAKGMINQIEVENVFAVKMNEEIPLDFFSDEAKSMLINAVFLKEIKCKLLQ